MKPPPPTSTHHCSPPPACDGCRVRRSVRGISWIRTGHRLQALGASSSRVLTKPHHGGRGRPYGHDRTKLPRASRRTDRAGRGPALGKVAGRGCHPVYGGVDRYVEPQLGILEGRDEAQRVITRIVEDTVSPTRSTSRTPPMSSFSAVPAWRARKALNVPLTWIMGGSTQRPSEYVRGQTHTKRDRS